LPQNAAVTTITITIQLLLLLRLHCCVREQRRPQVAAL
jgi:hypothetical protein